MLSAARAIVAVGAERHGSGISIALSWVAASEGLAGRSSQDCGATS